MLAADVALPLVLAGKRGVATCEVEDADVGAGMCRCDVALQSSGVFEGGVGAGFACHLAFGLLRSLGDTAALLRWRSLGIW